MTARFRTVARLSDRQLRVAHKVIQRTSSAVGSCLVVNVGGDTKLSLNRKGYVQIKVTPDPTHEDPFFHSAGSCTNTKVQLHQLVGWMHEEEGEFVFRQGIRAGDLELSHLCHNKACANPYHLTLEDSFTNKSRNYCEAMVIINGEEHSVCRHKPRCVITDRIRERALRFSVSTHKASCEFKRNKRKTFGGTTSGFPLGTDHILRRVLLFFQSKIA